MKPTKQHPDRSARVLVAVVLCVGTLAGCSVHHPFTSTKAAPAAPTVQQLAPDVTAVATAVVAIGGQVNLITATTHRFPGMTTGLAPLLALHRAQVDVLRPAVPGQLSAAARYGASDIQPSRQRAVLAVLAGENSLRNRLDDLALHARNGLFARLLATMAAGITEQFPGISMLSGQHSPALIKPPTFGPSPTASGSGSVPALQAALAAEHAAVYLFGVLGAQASASRQHALYDNLLAGYRAHRRCRDELTVLIGDHGAVPVAAAVTYELPAQMATATELNDAALGVERRIAVTYGQLVENTTGAERRWALVVLNEVAVRQVESRGIPEKFPGSH